MAERDAERMDAERAAKRAKRESPLVDREKALPEPAVRRLGQGAPASGAAAILGLQHTHGNAYVQRLLKSRAVQAKLTFNPPHYRYEREADAVADAFVRASNSRVQREEQHDEEVLGQSAAGQRQLMVRLLTLAADAFELGMDAEAQTAIERATELAVNVLKVRTEGVDVTAGKREAVVELLNAAADVMALGGDEKAVEKAMSTAVSWARGQLASAEKEMVQSPSGETLLKVVKNADLVYMLGGMSDDEFNDCMQRAASLWPEKESPKAAAASG